ncbi:MEDS domain-containing protein [Streptomyces sp. NPDC047821]|uniref:MEDS domain-containing protein n=1 Tax=Streptomyces sp. NPDC047821 TaxID=3365488 RepID=UPI003720BE29
MRAARTMAALDEIEVGDHVCWLMDPVGRFPDDADAFVSDGALFGDKVIIIGSAGATRWATGPDRDPQRPAVVVIDPHRLEESLLTVVQREARRADREGFRTVRVLTEAIPRSRGASPSQSLLEGELLLEEFAAESGAMVVCAYRSAHWDSLTLDQVMCVHPQSLGSWSSGPGFRMFSTGTNCWSVDGVIDSEGAEAFAAAVRAALTHAETVRLRFDRLQLIDAAGMRALADAVMDVPGRTVHIEGANETVRLCWDLSGFAVPEVPVEMIP